MAKRAQMQLTDTVQHDCRIEKGESRLEIGGSRLPLDRLESEQAWYALRVRSRSERLVGSVLATKGLTCFAPSLVRSRSRSGRAGQVHQAAFPGYLFCRFDSTERLPVLNTPGVQYIVGTARTPERVEESVILSLQAAFASNKRVVPTDYVRQGDPVQVVYGPLAGVTGVVVRLQGRDHLVISVDLLQRSVSVEIDADVVVRLRTPSVSESAARSNVVVKAAAR
jgi:transcriptional antiterminator NusG